MYFASKIKRVHYGGLEYQVSTRHADKLHIFAVFDHHCHIRTTTCTLSDETELNLLCVEIALFK